MRPSTLRRLFLVAVTYVAFASGLLASTPSSQASPATGSGVVQGQQLPG